MSEEHSHKCYLCGGEVGWVDDYSFSDFGCEGDGIVHVWECGACKCEYEIYERFGDEEE